MLTSVLMETLVAQTTIDNENFHFVLVNECYSDGDEPFTLFLYTHHYSAKRSERDRLFFHTQEAAFAYCLNKYHIGQNEWKNQIRFQKDFRFEYEVTNLGIPQPRPLGFENGKIVARLGERTDNSGNREAVLNLSGNRDGLRRLAAMFIVCAESEQFDNHFHIHLEDDDFALLDIPITLRSPSYFDHFVKDKKLHEGSAKTTIEYEENDC